MVLKVTEGARSPMVLKETEGALSPTVVQGIKSPPASAVDIHQTDQHKTSFYKTDLDKRIRQKWVNNMGNKWVNKWIHLMGQ